MPLASHAPDAGEHGLVRVGKGWGAGAGLTLFAGDVVSLYARYAGEVSFDRDFTGHAAETGLRLRF